MNFLSFGKKRKTYKVKKVKKVKVSKKTLRLCKKLKIKVTLKRGSKRVYKSTAVLKKLIKRKLRKLKKSRARR